MTRTPLAAALLAVLAACATGPGGDTETIPSANDNRITVLVENGTTDQLRVTARGAASLRLQAGQSGCLRVSPGVGRIQLTAEPLGGGENRTGFGGTGSGDGTDLIRSRDFLPSEASAWEWKIGRGALGGNQLQPADAPCGT